MKLDSRQESALGAAHGKANANELGWKDAARVRLMPSPTKKRQVQLSKVAKLSHAI